MCIGDAFSVPFIFSCFYLICLLASLLPAYARPISDTKSQPGLFVSSIPGPASITSTVAVFLRSSVIGSQSVKGCEGFKPIILFIWRHVRSASFIIFARVERALSYQNKLITRFKIS